MTWPQLGPAPGRLPVRFAQGRYQLQRQPVQARGTGLQQGRGARWEQAQEDTSRAPGNRAGTSGALQASCGAVQRPGGGGGGGGGVRLAASRVAQPRPSQEQAPPSQHGMAEQTEAPGHGQEPVPEAQTHVRPCPPQPSARQPQTAAGHLPAHPVQAPAPDPPVQQQAQGVQQQAQGAQQQQQAQPAQ